MKDIFKDLYDVVESRKGTHTENSYTCYLFEKGIDKMLKKVGEESSEVIIAAKNGKNEDTVNEIADLMYHLVVVMAEQGIKPDDLYEVLEKRSEKTGNLKVFHKVDKNS